MNRSSSRVVSENMKSLPGRSLLLVVAALSLPFLFNSCAPYDDTGYYGGYDSDGYASTGSYGFPHASALYINSHHTVAYGCRSCGYNPCRCSHKRNHYSYNKHQRPGNDRRPANYLSKSHHANPYHRDHDRSDHYSSGDRRQHSKSSNSRPKANPFTLVGTRSQQPRSSSTPHSNPNHASRTTSSQPNSADQRSRSSLGRESSSSTRSNQRSGSSNSRQRSSSAGSQSRENSGGRQSSRKRT